MLKHLPPLTYLLLLAIFVLPCESARAADNEDLSITVVARNMTHKRSEVWYFDVTVKNSTDSAIKIPYLYDAVLEIDGAIYVQFPKPIVYPDPLALVKAQSKEPHGTLSLNDKLMPTVDGRTGKIPLTILPGEHTLVIKLGDYQSPKVTFKVVE